MPKMRLMLDEINRENGLGVFLMAQMDGVPDTVQLLIGSAEYDPEAKGLRDKRQYVVRAVGVREHRFSVGLFKSIALQVGEEHPLLYGYNTKPIGVFFRGQPDNPPELVLDILQGYASTFGPWRQVPEFLNVTKPLLDLVSSGGGMLGEMPTPLAQRLEKVLLQHQLETKLIEAKPEEGQELPPPMQLLLLDDSYVVAMGFSVDELGKA